MRKEKQNNTKSGHIEIPNFIKKTFANFSNNIANNLVTFLLTSVGWFSLLVFTLASLPSRIDAIEKYIGDHKVSTESVNTDLLLIKTDMTYIKDTVNRIQDCVINGKCKQ